MSLRRQLGIAVLTAAPLALLLPALAIAVEIDMYSQQTDPGEAEVGTSVSSGGGSAGSPGAPSSNSSYPPTPGGGGGGTSQVASGGTHEGETVTFPDPRFRGAVGRTPYDPSGTACLYFPETPGACPTDPAPADPPGGRRGRAPPPIDPVAVAASIASRMPLLPGEIAANPARKGWAGVASWFWLDPAPRTIAAVAVLGAQRVVVTATPAPEWSFGDGTAGAAGVGRPYRRGAGTEGAVRHRYEVRCLPGDAGRNPYVLDTCAGSGYRVGADVRWTITFVATGPVTASGVLPSRTTSTSATYPVSELRGFLTSGSGS